MLSTSPRSIYAAFDRFPTRKGASTHIARFAPCLFDQTGGGLLYVLGDSSLPVHQLEGSVEIVRFSRVIENFLARALAFSAYLGKLIDRAGSRLSIAHFRDPWSGVPLISRAQGFRTLYEVNGLPSIELPHAFPGVSARTLEKVRSDELFCLDRCDAIVTPSHTTKALLESLGVRASKIAVVPNGADCTAGWPRPADAPPSYLIYFGALQSWQGVDTLLRAFARLQDLDLSLVVCGAGRSRDARRAERFAAKLGVEPRILWRWALPAAELAPWIAHAELSIAPLRECARNVTQGCAPLKILESMAHGVPVVASDLPPVRELIRDGVEGRLIAADRPAVLARTIRVLLAYPKLRHSLGENARARVAAEFSWTGSLELLRGVYRTLLA